MKNNKIAIILAFIAIYIIWGSTYLFNKILVQELPPFLLAGIRFVVAALIIFGIDLASGQRLIPKRHQIKNAGVAGFLFLTVGNGCAVWALKFIDSGFTALIISAQPMVLLIMLYFMERKPIYMKSLIGVVFGILGLYLLTQGSAYVDSRNQWLGVGAVFIALISWGYASIFVAKVDMPDNHLSNTGYQMFMGGGMMVVVSLIIGESWENVLHLSIKAVLSMAYLIIFGSIVAFTSFNFLLKNVSPEKVATSTYVNPLVAMALGWWVLDEVITSKALVAAGCLLLGVYFINSSRSKKLEEKPG